MKSPLVLEAAEAARSAPSAPMPARVLDILLDALALRMTEGYETAAPALKRALGLGLDLNAGQDASDRWLRQAGEESSR